MGSAAAGDAGWMTPVVGGIGTASLCSDLGHEVTTALLPAFLTTTLGAPAPGVTSPASGGTS